MDEPPPLFTGIKKFPLSQDYQLEADYFIIQDAPYPLNVLSLMAEGVVHES